MIHDKTREMSDDVTGQVVRSRLSVTEEPSSRICHKGGEILLNGFGERATDNKTDFPL